MPVEEDDVVMMEAVEPAPKPGKPVFTPPKPGHQKGDARFSSPPAKSSAAAKTDRRRQLGGVGRRASAKHEPQACGEARSIACGIWAPRGSPRISQQAIVAVEVGPSARERHTGRRWIGPAVRRRAAPGAASGLTPIGAAPGTAAPGTTPPGTSAPSAAPLTDLFSDPLALPENPLATAEPQPRSRKKRNVWDSPLLLIGGGLLGVMLVAFGLLWYSLTRGTAAEFLSQADEKYESGAYTDAIHLYEQFLERYPRNPSASKAKVRLGMAELRQMSSDGQNPKQG